MCLPYIYFEVREIYFVDDSVGEGGGTWLSSTFGVVCLCAKTLFNLIFRALEREKNSTSRVVVALFFEKHIYSVQLLMININNSICELFVSDRVVSSINLVARVSSRIHHSFLFSRVVFFVTV